MARGHAGGDGVGGEAAGDVLGDLSFAFGETVGVGDEWREVVGACGFDHDGDVRAGPVCER